MIKCKAVYVQPHEDAPYCIGYARDETTALSMIESFMRLRSIDNAFLVDAWVPDEYEDEIS